MLSQKDENASYFQNPPGRHTKDHLGAHYSLSIASVAAVGDDSWGIITAKKTCPRAGRGKGGWEQPKLVCMFGSCFPICVFICEPMTVFLGFPLWKPEALSWYKLLPLALPGATAHPTKPQGSRGLHRSSCHPDTGSPQGVQAEISTIPWLRSDQG